MPQKVTGPQKKVTDPTLLRELSKHGIDKDYVEFIQDYAPRSKGKGHSPYAKFYRDLKSGKQFMVVSGLPMVNADGVKVEVGWEKVSEPPIHFRAKPNQFSAKVTKTKVILQCINNQPSGARKGDEVTYKPQLFLNNIEQTCGEAVLLETDPTNPNYHQNVLGWDYGICKRRLRVIEGRIHGYWIFSVNPNGDVRIKYNQVGNFRLKLGEYAISDDEEIVSANVFNGAEYPFAISDSATYYPDADPESTSVDGFVYDRDNELTWAGIIAEPGSGAASNGLGEGGLYIYTHTTTDRWQHLYRGIILFDTSGLDDGAIISAAILSVYGEAAADPNSDSPDLNIYSSAPASNTELAAGDFDSLGSTPFATAIAYASWSIVGYNDFTLNNDGIDAILVDGISKFGSRNANYDVSGAAPTWEGGSVTTRMQYWHAEKGASYKPKLVVTYTLPVAKTSSDTGSGVGAKASGNPLATYARSDTGTGVGANVGGILFYSSDYGYCGTEQEG